MSIDLTRFENLKDAEFLSIAMQTPTSLKLTFHTQDSAKEFDWITLELAFEGVSDAKLLEDNKLHLVNLEDGATLLEQNNQIGFAIGSYKRFEALKDSVCYVIASSVKMAIKAF